MLKELVGERVGGDDREEGGELLGSCVGEGDEDSGEDEIGNAMT